MQATGRDFCAPPQVPFGEQLQASIVALLSSSPFRVCFQSFVIHAAGDGAGQQFPANWKKGGEGGYHPGGLILVEVNDEFVVFVYFSVRDLRPVEDLQIFLGFKEGEDLNAEGSQDEVGVADTMQGETEEDKSSRKRGETPPRGKKELIQQEAEN